MNDKVPSESDDTIRTGSPEAAGIPPKIGQYTIKREIARGGMGVVFEAVQDEPRRTVAVKVMKHGITSAEALRRFRYESQLLARLRHPGIAQVFEAGTHDDGMGSVPFFAMEYIPNAKTLTEYVNDKKLDVRERLELFTKVCDAVHHGHQRGIIHRDLKPGNVLVDSSGQPRIIDFGVARATDSDMATIQTEVGQIIGSVQYMSPEQFEADPNDIDTRSDVYALGIVLYELLCGELPYDVRNTTIIEAARIVREHTPARLSKTDPALRGDVETIIFTALEKDRARRYQSANGLGLDIRRYLNCEPIAARPPSVTYQMQVFARRHKPLVIAAASIIVILVGAAVASTASWLKAERERTRAEAQTDKTLAVVEFLKASLSSAVPAGYGADVGLRSVLDEAGRRLATAFPDDPATKAELHQTIGWGYFSLASWSDMEKNFSAALDIRREFFGPNHGQTVSSLEDLSALYDFTGQTSARSKILEQIIAAETALYGEEHEEAIGTRADLAIALMEDNRLNEAREAAEAVLNVRRRDLGENNEGTLDAQIVLALIALRQHYYQEAERLGRDALEKCSDKFEDLHWMTRRARSLLGAAYLAQGRIDESQALYGDKPAPENLGVLSSFQGDVASHTKGINVYIFWEEW